RVRAMNPGEIVVVGVDGVFRTVVRLAAPRAVIAVSARKQIHKVLVAVRHIAEAEFAFPVADVFLRRVMILSPIVAAGIEVIQLGRCERPVPAETHYVGGLLEIVVVRVEAGQSRWTVGAGNSRFTIESVVAGDALLLVEHVITLDAALVDGLHVCSVGDDVVIVDVAVGAGYGGGSVRRQHSAALENAERLHGRGIKHAFRNLVIRKLRPRYRAVVVHHLHGRIVNGNDLAVLADPFREIAVVHFRRRNGCGHVAGAVPVAEAFKGEEKKRLVASAVDLRDPYRAAERESKIVLFVNLPGFTQFVAEPVVGVEIVIAQKLVGGSVKIIGSRLRDERHHAAIGVAELSFEAVGVHGKLRYRFNRRRVRTDPDLLERARSIHRHAVQSRLIRRCLTAAESKSTVASLRFGFRSNGGEVERAADRASDHQRQGVDELLVYGNAGFGVLRLQLHGVRLDLDSLDGLAYFKVYVGVGGDCGIHGEPSNLGASESLLFHSDGVSSDGKIGNGEFADFVAGEVIGHIGCHIRDGDFGSGYHGAADV